MKKTGLIILMIISLAAFLRLCRTPDLLGFWYDQGRDALVVWDIWKNHRPTLIGPTTGIEGIFLGPFYYYLITPMYILGGGNPVVPAVGLVLINLVAIYLLFLLARKHLNSSIGLLAAYLIAVSFYLASSHRWLSNPTPLPLFSVVAVWSLINIVTGDKKLVNWAVLGLSVGLGLHLEAASAVFFLPAVLITLIWFRKKVIWCLPDVTVLAVGFFITLLPQLIFDFRHHHILFVAFRRFLVGEKSFVPQWNSLFIPRLEFYFTVFMEKLAVSAPLKIVLFLSLLSMLRFTRKIFSSITLQVILIWILSPVLGLLFYSGNKGYVWGYYFTGIYPFFILLVSSIFYHTYRRSSKAALLVIILIGLVTVDNSIRFIRYLTPKVPDYITLNQSLAAVDWVFTDAAGYPFNYDVYVPPVIYSAYDYLFLWRGTGFYRRLPEEKLVTRLYTLFEPDDDHRVLLDAWMTRQASIGSIEETRYFGLIGAQRRHRFITEENK